MNTKELLAHLCEVHHQLVVTSQKADEICDKFDNEWLTNRIIAINGDIDEVIKKVDELGCIYNFGGE